MTLARSTPTHVEVAPRGSGIAVLVDPDGAAHGVGFLAGDGAIVTCAHVVEATGAGPGDRVSLTFPHVPGLPSAVAWVDPAAWRHRDGTDVAVLRLDEVPAGAGVLPLGSAAGCRGHGLWMYGVPGPGPRGRFGYARAGDLLPDVDGDGQLLQLTDANDVTVGFSGSPVFDDETGLVIGMVTAIDRADQYQRGAGIAYATAVETLRQVDRALGEQTVCPYRGLAPFTAAHAAWFHGRAGAVQRVVASLTRRAVLLLGPSGSGKSSLVQAGVLPEITAGRAAPGSDGWAMITARPGTDLLAELEAAGLAGAVRDGLVHAVRGHPDTTSPGRRLLLIIDQFEEVFAQPAARDLLAQLEELVRSAAPPTLLLIMRDDFYPRFAAAAPTLLHALTPGVVNIPAVLTRGEATDIVERPAATVGLRFEPGLVARILADLEAAGDGSVPVTALPVLELAMLQLWERRADGRLTHDGYQRIGQLAGSLTARCDHSIAALDPALQPIARQVLTALVRPADLHQHTPSARRQVPLDQLRDLVGDDDAFEAVVRALTTPTPLIVTHARAGAPEAPPIAELIHDSLIRHWVTLRDWIAEDYRFHDWLRRAEEQRQHWTGTTNRADLLAGVELAEGLSWSRQSRLPGAVAAFLGASERAATARARRVRTVMIAMVMLLVLTVSAAVFASYQSNKAGQLRQAAQSRQAAVQSEANATGNPDLSALLAVHAYRMSRTPEAAARLNDAYAATAALAHTFESGGGSVHAIAANEDESILAAGTAHGTVQLWDLRDGSRTSLPSPGGGGAVTAVAFAPHGNALAVGDETTVQIWDLVTRRVRELPGDLTFPVSTLAYSPDGATLAVGTEDGDVLTWSVPSDTVTTVHHGMDVVHAVAFSPDGHTLASADDDNTVSLWDARTRKLRRVLEHHTDSVTSLSFSPDSHTLATGSYDNRVLIWPVAAGTPSDVAQYPDSITSVAFSPDGSTLAVGDGDGRLQLHDPTGAVGERRLLGHTNTVASMTYLPKRKRLVTGSADGTVRLWDTAAGADDHLLRGHDGLVDAVAFAPNSNQLVSGDDDGELRLWDGTTGTVLGHQDGAISTVAFGPHGHVASGGSDHKVHLWDMAATVEAQRHRILPAHEDSITALAFNRDGTLLASGSYDNSIRLWNTADRRATKIPSGHTDTVTSLAFNHDQTLLASGGDDGLVTLWDLAAGRPRSHLVDPSGQVKSVAFSPSGDAVATGGADGTIRVWNLTGGEPRLSLIGHTGPVRSVAFSPDGRTLASGSEDMTIRLWNTRTGDRERTLISGDVYVRSVAFSPDGRTLAGGGRMVGLWSTTSPGPDEVHRHICSAIGHDLDPDQAQVYLDDRSAPPVCPP
ncbi:nSTAND1 domain-containing NTPase [Winogradskya humida]|uniref:Novel STAND NTPase 1 domain-containing protein n=1 Tax=Winogradskya humida TaxID=113566 RepID=A0ABQ4A105_9ACTN|nr:trypsin-like peptidase domain-containing protein [Actinoplanes humidus]GIE24526.1 hypothetical protein Ahu01nite_076280 [Actinoplanes humidus]